MAKVKISNIAFVCNRHYQLITSAAKREIKKYPAWSNPAVIIICDFCDGPAEYLIPRKPAIDYSKFAYGDKHG